MINQNYQSCGGIVSDILVNQKVLESFWRLGLLSRTKGNSFFLWLNQKANNLWLTWTSNKTHWYSLSFGCFDNSLKYTYFSNSTPLWSFTLSAYVSDILAKCTTWSLIRFDGYEPIKLPIFNKRKTSSRKKLKKNILLKCIHYLGMLNCSFSRKKYCFNNLIVNELRKEVTCEGIGKFEFQFQW